MALKQTFSQIIRKFSLLLTGVVFRQSRDVSIPRNGKGGECVAVCFGMGKCKEGNGAVGKGG